MPERLQEEPDPRRARQLFGFPANSTPQAGRARFSQPRVRARAQAVDGQSARLSISRRARRKARLSTRSGRDGAEVSAASGARASSGTGKSFFLHDLLSKVIFGEIGLGVAQHRMPNGALRRSDMAGFTLVGLASAVALGALAMSFSTTAISSPRHGAPWSSIARTAGRPAQGQYGRRHRPGKRHRPARCLAKSSCRLRQSRRSAVPVAGDARLQPAPAAPTPPPRPLTAQALERMFRSRLLLQLEETDRSQHD